ncbi:MAG: type IV pilus twitching motility protein PilT [Christensenellaceae bacterium]
MSRIRDIIATCAKAGASDVHLHEGDRPYLRRHGIVSRIEGGAVIEREDFLAFMDEIGLTDERKGDIERLGSCDFGIRLEEVGVSLRLNFYKQAKKLGLAVRCLSGNIPPFEALNLPEVMKNVVRQKSGLVLVTGLTGNGKSTTIASLVNLINRTESKHIVTIEDPIEYRYPLGKCLVTQREIPVDCNSFEEGLRSALRQDPDIIVIGEMRDRETIQVTLEAAESGHLVFSTLHTSSAAASIDRIVSYFSEAEQNNIRSKLSSVLAAVFTQKLIPAVSGNGTYPAVEIMFPAIPIRALIREGKIYQITNYIRLNAQSDMVCMDDALVKLVREGKISRENALINANDVQALSNALLRK